MSAASPVLPLAIVGCGAVTPAGLGVDVLGELVANGRPGHSDVSHDCQEQFPPRPLRAVPELRLSDHIKARGTRNMDRMTGMALVACKQALAEADPPAPGTPVPGMPALGTPETRMSEPGTTGAEPTEAEKRARTGVVLGTSMGSVPSVAEQAYDTLTLDRPYLVNPARFPNTVMNAAAGQVAIRNSLRGVNATLAGGLLSSMHAIRCARSMIASGRAGRLVVCGIEELSPHTAWGWHRLNALAPQIALGEGCAALVLDDASQARAMADVLACEVQFCGGPPLRPAALISGLTSCVRRALARSDIEPGEVDAVSLGSVGFVGLERAERRAVRGAIGRIPQEVRITQAVGVAYSATSSLQIAAQLGMWRAGESVRRLVLFTALGLDGNVGCVLIRKR